MSKTQLDLELDATGIEEQLGDLAAKAVEMGAAWVLSLNRETLASTMQLDNPKLLALLKQAAAVQHLLDLKRKGGSHATRPT